MYAKLCLITIISLFLEKMREKGAILWRYDPFEQTENVTTSFAQYTGNLLLKKDTSASLKILQENVSLDFF